MVARSQRKSRGKAKSGGSGSRSAGAAQGGAGRAPGRSWRRTILLSAVLAAGVVLAGGPAFYIFRDRADEAPPGAPSEARFATVLGSPTLAGCPPPPARPVPGPPPQPPHD